MATTRTAILTIGIALVVVLGGLGMYVLASGPKTGTVSIYIKDLPADWTHVNVTFSEVRIHKADAGNDSGWKTLELKGQTIDLASLTNMTSLLASGNVSVGKYTQIRFVVVSVVGTMANGSVVNFTVPSGELKTTHPFNVTADRTQTITLDFDLSHSILQKPNGWIFKPVLGPVTSS